MQNAARVRGGQSGADLTADIDRFVFGKTTDAMNQAGEIFTMHVLHGDEVLPIRFADVIDTAYIGMGDLPGKANFPQESRGVLGAAADLFRQQFERHRLSELQIVSAVDLA